MSVLATVGSVGSAGAAGGAVRLAGALAAGARLVSFLAPAI
jgi:hypothetical protein